MAEYQVADIDLHTIDTELEGMPSSMVHRSEIRSINAFRAKRLLASIGLAMSIVLIVPDFALGQQSNKSLQSSADSPRATVSTASASRSAEITTAPKPNESPTDSGGLITIERINELTGFVPASDAEVQQLVATMQAAVKAKDATALKACFDVKQILNRQTVGADVGPTLRSAMVRENNPCASMARQAVKANTDFQLLRFNRRGLELRPIFRLVTGNVIVKYAEFVIATGVGQNPKIVDIFSSSSGDYLCVTGRLHILGPLLSDRSPVQIPRAGIEAAIIESADGLTDFTLCMSEGDREGALVSLNNLRPPYDQSLVILDNKCTISRLIGPKAFRSAVLHLNQRYPEAIPSELKLLELYQMEKNPVEMINVADRLLKSMQDPWLNAYRIDGLVSQNRIKEAREAIAAAKAAVPNISDPYVSELGMLMKFKNHQETAQAIETLETKFGENVIKLTSFPEFDEFSDSEVGRRFLARRAGFDF